MKGFDRFFEGVLALQWMIHRNKRRFGRYAALVQGTAFAAVILSVLLLWMNILVGSILVSVVAFSLMGLTVVFGWQDMFRKWLAIVGMYGICFILPIGYLHSFGKYFFALASLYILIYASLWSALSILSGSKGALVVNETVSGIIATVFTIGTYLMGGQQNAASYIFGSFLPMIGISAFSIVLVKLKIFWLEQNPARKEPQDLV